MCVCVCVCVYIMYLFATVRFYFRLLILATDLLFVWIFDVAYLRLHSDKKKIIWLVGDILEAHKFRNVHSFLITIVVVCLKVTD